MRAIILGPQGSGKGTQAELLSKRYSVPHIDVGQLLREHIARKTETGKKLEEPMKKGELLPCDLVDKIVEKRLEEPDCKKGFVLDGYPRQLEEAEFLDSISEINAVLVLEIPDDVAVQRLSARRVCVGCSATLYGLLEEIGKECQECGGRLVQREDDKPEAVKRRLTLYHEETEPLIEYYKPRDILHMIDGTGTVEGVFQRIMRELS